MPYLRRFQVTIDFANEAIYLAKGKRYDDPEEPSDRSGLHLLRRAGSIEVHSADRDSPSERAGIRAKDRIVQIDGKPVAEFRLCQIRRLLKSPVGTVVRMTIQRDGKASDVSFALKELSAADPRPK
jgi:carboxyl-terminal processing protease